MAADLFQQQAQALVEAGRILHDQGWVPATSGNLSARIGDDRVAITVSGRHKGRLTVADVMQVDLQGRPVDSTLRPSAETLLHVQLYRRDPQIGAVLHTHSVNATLASRLAQDHIDLYDYELLKILPGITTHSTAIKLPVFENDQDMTRLADLVEQYMDQHDGPLQAYLIAGHGLYAWGADMQSTLNYLEAYEFLLSCELRQREIRL